MSDREEVESPCTCTFTDVIQAQHVSSSALPKRDDTSLFRPSSHLPGVEDVLDCGLIRDTLTPGLMPDSVTASFATLPKDDPDYLFKNTFALVAYALVHFEKGEQLKALFHHPEDQGEGIYELNYYEPVNHERSSVMVGYEGLLTFDDKEDLGDFKDRWSVSCTLSWLLKQRPRKTYIC